MKPGLDGKIDFERTSLANFMGFHDKDLFKKTELFYQFIQEFKKQGFGLYRRPLVSATDNRAMVWDEQTGKVREMIMMGSNNYLGLANHPKVIEAVEKAVKKYGAGSGGAQLLSGTFELHRELERRLAKLEGYEDAVLFTSGFAANLGALAGLLNHKDVVINDKLNHASIIDGCRLSSAHVEIFGHNDMEHLESILRYADERWNGKLVVVDGVFSMDGDMAPLAKIVELKEKYKAYLMVDEAHATGVVGSGGRGSLAYHGLEGKADVVVVTFSKALGCQGGAVVAKKEVAEYLRFFSRASFFSTNLSPVLVAGALAAVDILENEPERHQKLWENISYMVEKLKAMGYDLGNTQSAIIPIIIKDEKKLREMSIDIHNAGIYLNAIPYPAVPRGQARFRLTVIATHTREDLDRTLEVLSDVGKKFGVLH
jgi:glycine C-acetyltransferase